LVVVACADHGQGRPPVARIAAAPRAIPEGDDFRTDVVIDGRGSTDPVDDPEGTAPLSFRWRIEGDEARFVDGHESSATATIRLAGRRPARLHLTVTDEDGDDATDVHALQLTIEDR
jgi:hypothetical protein